MKVYRISILLTALCVLMPLHGRAEEQRELRVFNALSRSGAHDAVPIFSTKALNADDAPWVAFDKLNSVACVISSDRKLVFFIFTNAFGVPTAVMGHQNGVYM